MLGITGSFTKAMGGAETAINGYGCVVGNAQIGYGWNKENEFTEAMYDHHMRQAAGQLGGDHPIPSHGHPYWPLADGTLRDLLWANRGYMLGRDFEPVKLSIEASSPKMEPSPTGRSGGLSDW
ncbi:hypothetical protein QQS21_011036 [Conoideocrella luteorostrata]|uniref:Uncharacterized protein n=1 Tax=Conoideocrella luteorostrata TaxID=1105319 RepID=A0AAJ0FTN9_9HYPO|nr:hypothetical protein QQS21_011036 [Conoideocrella luteorostrata]